jgi:hypothetical protein
VKNNLVIAGNGKGFFVGEKQSRGRWRNRIASSVKNNLGVAGNGK